MCLNTNKHRALKDVNDFTYLGSTVTKHGEDEDVKQHIKKANGAFIQLYLIWKSKTVTTQTKLRIFRSNVKSVLLYGSKSWKVTNQITNRLQVFVNRCLRRILNIYWPETMSNEQLRKTAKEDSIKNQTRRRKWNWLGHTLRKTERSTERQALDWNPQGDRKRGRPEQSSRRTIEEEGWEGGKSWKEVKRITTNSVRWWCFVDALCSNRNERN